MDCDLTSSGADTADKTCGADLDYHKLFKSGLKKIMLCTREDVIMSVVCNLLDSDVRHGCISTST